MINPEFPGKDTLFEAMRQGQARVHETIARLGAERLTVPTDAADWTGKDHLAHLTAWERSLISWLTGGTRSEGLGIDEALFATRDLGAINEAIRKATGHLTLDDVLAEHDRARAALGDVVAALPPEDLLKPYAHYPPDDPGIEVPPVYLRVLRVVGSHVDDHLGYIEAIAASP